MLFFPSFQNQSPVDVCDHPVFALTKENQWRYPEKFGSGSYFSLFGGLYFEQCMQTIHGELIKGSGLENVLSNIDMSIIGTGAVVHASHIKQARYCLKVSFCALFLTLYFMLKNGQIYFKNLMLFTMQDFESMFGHFWNKGLKLKDAKDKLDSTLSSLEWLEQSKNQDEMCYLLYVRSLRIKLQTRESCHEKFNGYVLDLHNHAWWATAHLFDLMALCSTCPDVYTQFLKWKNKRRQWSHAFIK